MTKKNYVVLFLIFLVIANIDDYITSTSHGDTFRIDLLDNIFFSILIILNTLPACIIGTAINKHLLKDTQSLRAKAVIIGLIFVNILVFPY